VVRHDLVHSVSTLLLGGALGVATTWLVLAGVIPLGTDVPSAGRIALEVAAYVLCFDAYFYGLHRLLHTRALYRRVHAVHHRATRPTVATALAFHPLEALAILGFVPMAMCLVPIHVVSLALVCAFLSTSILLAHAARDPFPDGWQRLPVLGWYVTPREHHVHHARRDCNYSATFSLFDRAFGTLHAGDAAAD
jgi:sterol desaturase/sphingolipid hydroxylase (fatty acid hydroxylase superfamily)